MASIINATTTTGVAVTGDNSGALALQTNNGTTAVTIDTSQNVGIGTSSPASRLSVTGSANIATFDGGSATSISLTGSSRSDIFLIDSGAATDQKRLTIRGNDGNFVFGVENDAVTTFTERMRIGSSGDVTISTGILGFSSAAGVNTPTANGQGYIGTYNVYGTTITGQGSAYDISFFNKNGGVAGYVATGATTITTSSDERLKENLAPITNALATVNNLRTVTGNYKADPSRNVAFFVAQDMKEHFPQAFEDANPDAFGVNYNWTIPLLAAAIKELKAIVEAQAVRIAELEGAK
jgi:hypothetical protein